MSVSTFKNESMALDDMAEFFPSGQDFLKRRSFKKRRKRNRSNIFYLLESAGKISEESDTTDEALRDYMENIAAQSDSDLDSNMTKRLSSLRCQLNNLSNGCPDPYQYYDKAESDSCSEVNYQKKRRKRKRKHKKMCGNSYPVSVTLQPSMLKVPPPLTMDTNDLQPVHITTNKHVILKAHRSRLNDDDFLADAENGHTSSCGENLNHMLGSMSCSVERVRHSWPSMQDMDICNDDDESETMYDSSLTPESSALSSSSEDELFTNDEGQLGDDEQEESCYETDSQCSWLRGRSNSDDEDKKFHELYRETLEYLKSKPFFLEEDQGVF